MSTKPESFVGCFPYTAVAALLPGESVRFEDTSEDGIDWTIERSNSGHGYIVTPALCEPEYYATAREVRERIIGTPFASPLVSLS